MSQVHVSGPMAHECERLPRFTAARADTQRAAVRLLKAAYGLARDTLSVTGVSAGRGLADALIQLDYGEGTLTAMWRVEPSHDQRSAVGRAWAALTGSLAVRHLIQPPAAVGDLDASLCGGSRA
jgi:hypothetical protein